MKTSLSVRPPTENELTLSGDKKKWELNMCEDSGKNNSTRNLSFFTISDSGEGSFWRKGLQNGRAIADELCAVIESSENPFLLGWTVRDQMKSGVFGLVEIEFWNRMAERLIVAS